MYAVSAGISEVLIKYTGKYVKIYFMKISFINPSTVSKCATILPVSWMVISAVGKKKVCSDRILTFGIRSIRSPAKVGIGYYKAVKLPAR